VLFNYQFCDVEVEAYLADLLTIQRIHAKELAKKSVLEFFRDSKPFITYRNGNGSVLS